MRFSAVRLRGCKSTLSCSFSVTSLARCLRLYFQAYLAAQVSGTGRAVTSDGFREYSLNGSSAHLPAPQPAVSKRTQPLRLPVAKREVDFGELPKSSASAIGITIGRFFAQRWLSRIANVTRRLLLSSSSLQSLGARIGGKTPSVVFEEADWKRRP